MKSEKCSAETDAAHRTELCECMPNYTCPNHPKGYKPIFERNDDFDEVTLIAPAPSEPGESAEQSVKENMQQKERVFTEMLDHCTATLRAQLQERDTRIQRLLKLLEPASEWMSADEIEWWKEYNELTGK